MSASVSLSQRATSSPTAIEPASEVSAESVIGMGQKRLFCEGRW
jgi:hypothetical protein